MRYICEYCQQIWDEDQLDGELMCPECFEQVKKYRGKYDDDCDDQDEQLDDFQEEDELDDYDDQNEQLDDDEYYSRHNKRNKYDDQYEDDDY